MTGHRKVKEWHSWCESNYWHPGMARPAGEDPVPPTCIGTLAGSRGGPFKACLSSGRLRSWRDFGCGVLAIRMHIFDPVFTAARSGAPTKIRPNTGSRPEVGRRDVIRYEFPGTKRTAGRVQGTCTMPTNGTVGVVTLPRRDAAGKRFIIVRGRRHGPAHCTRRGLSAERYANARCQGGADQHLENGLPRQRHARRPPVRLQRPADRGVLLVGGESRPARRSVDARVQVRMSEANARSAVPTGRRRCGRYAAGERA